MRLLQALLLPVVLSHSAAGEYSTFVPSTPAVPFFSLSSTSLPTPTLQPIPGIVPISPEAAGASPSTSIPLTGDQAPGSDGTPVATAVPVSVVLQQKSGANVTLTGKVEDGLDKFLGVPYAEPPTGPLRFAPPVRKTYNGSVLATTPCVPANMKGVSPLVAYDMSEDCLSLNVMGPSGHAQQGAKLPVMVWIHGGDFTEDSSTAYLSSSLVTYGAKTKRPFVFVALNYRLDIFGFGAGREIVKRGASNLGLWDQRLALEWVRDHVGSFGGDRTKVTVFGHSAGATSISIHMLNTTQDLFRAAIMMSGAPQLVPDSRGAMYETISSITRCKDGRVPSSEPSQPGIASAASSPSSSEGAIIGSAAEVSPTGASPLLTTAPGASAALSVALAVRGSATPSPSSPDSTPPSSPPLPPPAELESIFECIKALPGAEILDAESQSGVTSELVNGPTVDGKDGLIPKRPHDLMKQGKIARIPFITGNMRDEGTYFAAPMFSGSWTTPKSTPLHNASSPLNHTRGITVAEYLDLVYPAFDSYKKARDKVITAYPVAPALGAPFGTGNETFGLLPSFKQVSALITDILVARRREFIRSANKAGWYKTWSYEFAVGPRVSEMHPAHLGYTHGDELPYVFGGVNTNTHTLGDLSLSESMLNYWVNFAYYLDPNGQVASESSVNAAVSTYWRPQMYPNDKNAMLFTANGTAMREDDTREKQQRVFGKKHVYKAMDSVVDSRLRPQDDGR